MYEQSWATGASPHRALTGVLLLEQAGLAPQAVPVDRPLLIGRDEGCDVVLASTLVSRRHARVWLHDDGLAVEDLGSSNGTRLNGRRIASPVQLEDGDTLTLGDVHVRVRLISAHPAAEPALASAATADRHEPPRPGPAEPRLSQDSHGGGAKMVALAVLESLVGTAFSQAVGTGLAGTYALAAITPLVGTAFTVRKDGRMRIGAVVLVTLVAVGLTVAGVTAADTALGRSVFPWSTSGRTFVPPPDSGSDSATKLIMPTLKGENNVVAMQLLIRYGFHMQNVLFVNEPASRESFGTVVRTDPAAGSTVPEDAVVRIYIGT